MVFCIDQVCDTIANKAFSVFSPRYRGSGGKDHILQVSPVHRRRIAGSLVKNEISDRVPSFRPEYPRLE